VLATDVTRQKRPTWVRALRLTKLFIEHRVGMGVGDALNIALFFLTLLSLALGVIGTWVAIKAMREAKSGGEEQQRTLVASRQSLENAENDLTKLNETLNSNLKTAKDQQQLLQKASDVAREQLSILSAQNEREAHLASRRTNVNMTVSCAPAFNYPGATWVGQYELTVGPNKYLLNGQKVHGGWFDRPAHGVNGDFAGQVGCYFTLNNLGEISLTNAFIKIHVEIWLRGQPPSNNVMGPGLKYQITDPERNPVYGAGDIPYSEVVDTQYIDVLSGRTVFPESSHVSYPVTTFVTLAIPLDVDKLGIDYEFGGNEQSPIVFADMIMIDQTKAFKNKELQKDESAVPQPH
jgi:hypothetical protein